MKLLIVESPNKCKTIAGFLGGDWKVEASIGHITELANDGDGNLGFDLTQSGVDCRYVPRGERGEKQIKKLRAIAKDAEAIYLATDPDREGESISWHLVQQVCGRKPVHRVTYTQITESAIKGAIASPRQLDQDLINAQFARQCLDKLVGYKLSPLVMNAGGGRSAGRVQSAALHLVCQREREIQNFKPVPYWALQAEYKEGFKAVYLGSEAVAEAADETDAPVDESADPSSAAQTESKRVSSEAEAQRIVAIAQSNPHKVIEFSGKQAQKSPPPPLTTSALQQAAGVKFGMSSEDVMKIAQELFEGVNLPDGSKHGAITYHRTDSISLAPEFCAEVKHWLEGTHPELVPAKATKFKDKDGAQGAHEAIRPVEVKFTPESMKQYLTEAQWKVYSLIWQRAIASQCAPAQLEKSRAVIQSGSTFWEARGSVLKAPGYTKIWENLGDDSQLPTLQQGQGLNVEKVSHQAKQTTPPGRYSEPQLVQRLERLGIGRPSTFANIMKTLKDREYVAVQKKVLVPTKVGMKTDEVLQKVFPSVLDAKFTATMEEALDKVAEGGLDWQKYLVDFHFKVFDPALREKGAAVVQNAFKRSDKPCPSCSTPLSEVSFTKPVQSPVKHYLKCMAGCSGVVMFWNSGKEAWLTKDEIDQMKANAPAPTGEKTEFVCQNCGEALLAISYVKEGQQKTRLQCPKHKDEVYFQSSKGGFWNFNTKMEPAKEKGKKPAAGKSKTGRSKKSA